MSGTTLTWKPLPGATNYKLAIFAPGAPRGPTYRLIRGTAFTPPAVPATTVTYVLQANVAKAQWSSAVAITWPAKVPAVPAGTKLKVAVMNTTGWGVDSIFYKAGITYTRLDVGSGDLTLVTKALMDGITPLVLYNPNANLESDSTSQIAGEVVTLAQRLNSLAETYPIMNKLHVIEFGNEVYAYENAATYAAQYDAAHRALAANGLSSWKLLAVGTALCGAYHAEQWIPDFIHDLSGGAAEVDGWTIHPYGSITGDAVCASSAFGHGWADVASWHSIAVNTGSNAPWYITEVGQCVVSGGACHTPVDEATQASDMTEYLNDVASKYPWVVYFDWYTSCDDTSGGFGLVNKYSSGVCGSSVRPAFTAMQRWIAVHGEG